MNDSTPDLTCTPYGPSHFPQDEPFARRGYLFVVPSSFPQDIPPRADLTDWEMAVYRTTEHRDEWEVRDVASERRVWGAGRSWRDAIDHAFLEIARKRRAHATADRRAAAIFKAAFNAAFEDDDWLTIGVDNGHGAEVHVTGQFFDGEIRFEPVDVDMLLTFLTRVLLTDEPRYAPYGVVSVKTPHEDGEPYAMAWHLGDMRPLSRDQAVSWLGSDVTYTDDARPLNPDRITNTDATALTDEVKTLLADRLADDGRHGSPGKHAGQCAQCLRPLTWDRTGKRLNDEWGEYLCRGARLANNRSSTHVLAKN
ncbi:hypothetical protein [Streptomyces sp. AGS-58]|uniref:hypothetical protein n=1 Tax=unclassified Streptomyces TaxID=2593676 RepID=UPI0035A334E5